LPLTKNELNDLPTFVKLAHSMHIVATTFERCKKNNKSKENMHWYKQGRAGLQQN